MSSVKCVLFVLFFFFFNDTATTEIYTLSLHDALPISGVREFAARFGPVRGRGTIDGGRRRMGHRRAPRRSGRPRRDRKSTRLNSSHLVISYAVFCLKKKKKNAETSAAHLHYSQSRSAN